MSQIKAVVALLSKNEGAQIKGAIYSVKSVLQGIPQLSVVYYLVDDSEDKTPLIAEELGFKILSPGNKGLGHAYRYALEHFRQHETFDLLITMDADGQVVPAELPTFLHALQTTGSDMIVGSRFIGKKLIKYRYPLLNRFGVWILGNYLTLVTGKKFTDSHGGIRIMNFNVATALEIHGSHTYVQETIVDAVRKGFKVTEIPSLWTERSHGTSRVVNDIPKYIIKTLPYLVAAIFQRPLKRGER